MQEFYMNKTTLNIYVVFIYHYFSQKFLDKENRALYTIANIISSIHHKRNTYVANTTLLWKLAYTCRYHFLCLPLLNKNLSTWISNTEVERGFVNTVSSYFLCLFFLTGDLNNVIRIH